MVKSYLRFAERPGKRASGVNVVIDLARPRASEGFQCKFAPAAGQADL